MTNEEILGSCSSFNPDQEDEFVNILNLARQDEREKCLKILAGKMFELQFMFNKVYEKTYQDRETLTLPELQQRIADIADVMQRIRSESERQDEREKMQGVEVWVSWDEHKQYKRDSAYISDNKPEVIEMDDYDTYYKLEGGGIATSVRCELAEKLGVKTGQCKKFRIVEELT